MLLPPIKEAQGHNSHSCIHCIKGTASREICLRFVYHKSAVPQSPTATRNISIILSFWRIEVLFATFVDPQCHWYGTSALYIPFNEKSVKISSGPIHLPNCHLPAPTPQKRKIFHWNRADYFTSTSSHRNS